MKFGAPHSYISISSCNYGDFEKIHGGGNLDTQLG